ncbi:MAG: hypothetical protein V7749_00675 [Cocleimonas sp.]
MELKLNLIACAVIGLLGVNASALASPESSASARESEQTAFEQRYLVIDNGVSIIDSVRSAILSSYIKNNSWPTNTSVLVGGGYLSSIRSSWGQNVIGTASGGGNSYTISLNAPSPEIAQAIAAKIAGVAAGSSVQFTIPIPAMASINRNNLSRVVVAGEPDLNKMFTDIDMNSFSLGNVNEIDAVVINGTTAKIGALTIDTSLDVIPDATFRRNVTIVGNGTVDEFTANAIAVNGGLQAETFLRTSGDVNGKNIIASQDIVAGSQVRANSAVFLGGVTADSAIVKSGSIDNLVSKNVTVQNMFISQGNAEFYQNALFKGSVTIDGALSVGGIASAMDIREGGLLLKDKYSQLAAVNVFTENNTFNKTVAINGGVTVDGKQVISADGNNLYENNVSLSSKYLGINAKADSAISADHAINADKLGNVTASSFARRDANNTFTSNNTFNKTVALNGGVTVDGKQVISADGSTLYESGQALNTRYLGINATAKNSDKLGNVASSNYARTDVVETFGQSVNFNNGIHVKSNWVRVDGDSGIYFQSHGGGWHMDDSTYIKAYGGKSIYTSGMVRADNGIQVDGKWVVSTNGNTLYENNVALSAKYLGKNNTASDSSKLGGYSAGYYARKNTANTFSSRQTFNGGISTGGTSYLGSVSLNGNLSFRDYSGVTKNLKTMSSDVESLKKWKAACQRSLSDRDCGLDNGSAGNTGTTLYSSTYGLNGGNFVLSQSYANFDYIEVWGTNDGNEQGAVTTWTPEQIDFLQATSSSSKALTLWSTDNEYWTGRFATNKRSFNTYQENAKIRKVVGFNI